MKHYYATELDRENFNPEIYFNEDNALSHNIWLGGNRDLLTLNQGLYNRGKEFLEDMDKTFLACWDEADDSCDYVKQVYIMQLEAIRKYTGINEITKLDELCSIVEDYRHAEFLSTEEEIAIICNVLSIVKNKSFNYTVLRGSSQRDWIYCIYSEDDNCEDFLKYVGAVYFNTGTEYEITMDPIEEDDVDDTETYTGYTYESDPDKIKKWVADNIGCTPKEVILRNIIDYTIIKHYKYAEK